MPNYPQYTPYTGDPYSYGVTGGEHNYFSEMGITPTTPPGPGPVSLPSSGGDDSGGSGDVNIAYPGAPPDTSNMTYDEYMEWVNAPSDKSSSGGFDISSLIPKNISSRLGGVGAGLIGSAVAGLPGSLLASGAYDIGSLYKQYQAAQKAGFTPNLSFWDYFKAAMPFVSPESRMAKSTWEFTPPPNPEPTEEDLARMGSGNWWDMINDPSRNISNPENQIDVEQLPPPPEINTEFLLPPTIGRGEQELTELMQTDPDVLRDIHNSQRSFSVSDWEDMYRQTERGQRPAGDLTIPAPQPAPPSPQASSVFDLQPTGPVTDMPAPAYNPDSRAPTMVEGGIRNQATPQQLAALVQSPTLMEQPNIAKAIWDRYDTLAGVPQGAQYGYEPSMESDTIPLSHTIMAPPYGAPYDRSTFPTTDSGAPIAPWRDFTLSPNLPPGGIWREPDMAPQEQEESRPSDYEQWSTPEDVWENYAPGETYGEYAVGGAIKGPGSGMDDMIPATIEGRQMAKLSNDEFVVPADVVSALGDGSSDSGHKRLYQFISDIRQTKTGNPQQPPKLMSALRGLNENARGIKPTTFISDVIKMKQAFNPGRDEDRSYASEYIRAIKSVMEAR